jgi:putative oxidoreductase
MIAHQETNTMPISIKTLYQRALQLCAKLAWIGPLAVRIVIGIAFVITGWGKLTNLAKVTGYFESLHIPLAGPQAAMVSTIEFVGGLLLIVGLGTRIVSLLLIGVMTVAILTAKLGEADGFVDFLTSLPTTIELTYLVTFVWLLLGGAGPASIDHWIARRGQDSSPLPQSGVNPAH